MPRPGAGLGALPGGVVLLPGGVHHVLFLDQVARILDQSEKLVDVGLVAVEPLFGRLFCAERENTSSAINA